MCRYVTEKISQLTSQNINKFISSSFSLPPNPELFKKKLFASVLGEIRLKFVIFHFKIDLLKKKQNTKKSFRKSFAQNFNKFNHKTLSLKTSPSHLSHSHQKKLHTNRFK